MACESNHTRLLCMLLLTFGYFIVEVVVSQITGSLSLLSDSFHMLSDVIALIVGLVSVRFAKKIHATNKNTFGWIRAEVIGALVNAVFLTALCFTIVLNAIQRVIEPHQIDNPLVVVGVGAAGLLVNLFGLCLFHGHAGGGQGSSHGSKGKKEVSCEDSTEVAMDENAADEETDHEHTSSQLNMHGVFLHVMGDALGSVIVVVNTAIFYFVWNPCRAGEMCVNPCVKQQRANHTSVDPPLGAAGPTRTAGPCWVLYLDPALCIIMVTILLYTAFPLVRESVLILLQTVPKQVNMHGLQQRLLDLEGILAVHELHVWQLAGRRIIATAHIKCQDPPSYMELAKRIKDFFHHEGIHATTVQPEFVALVAEPQDSQCELSCREQCAAMLCCRADDRPHPDRKAASATGLQVIGEAEGEQVRGEESSL
ncbi:unnamed protein product [Ophioblennius macclurei]